MKDLFKKRRSLFVARCIKYLRYVFNDHFILVLIFLLGFLMVQYSRLLRNFPKGHLPIILVLILILIVLLSMGKIGTYIEPADKVFLLTKEEEIISWVKKAKKVAFIIWGGLQTAVLLFLMPIFLKLGLTIRGFCILLCLLLFVKWLVLEIKGKTFFNHGFLAWDRAIAYENNRKQSILKFFSLFTNVKGISTSIKRRQFLDFCLTVIPKIHTRTWSNLYLRAFLRSSDYLGLTIRLLVLSLLSLLFISNRLVAVGLASIFNYLLAFQLLALYRHFDYQYLTQLYPLSEEDKIGNLKFILKRLMYMVLLTELAIVFSWQGVLLLLGVNLIITEWYLPYKINKMID